MNERYQKYPVFASHFHGHWPANAAACLFHDLTLKWPSHCMDGRYAHQVTLQPWRNQRRLVDGQQSGRRTRRRQGYGRQEAGPAFAQKLRPGKKRKHVGGKTSNAPSPSTFPKATGDGQLWRGESRVWKAPRRNNLKFFGIERESISPVPRPDECLPSGNCIRRVSLFEISLGNFD
jgi:hypothetical protein